MNRRDVLKMIGAGSVTPFIHASVSTAASTRRSAAAKYPYQLVVYGATPAGIACAVRAAREGLAVLLVEHSPRVGGMFSNGLSVMDTLYAGARAPIYDEFRWSIHDFYRTKYGPDSTQFSASRPGHPKAYYEAHLAESLMAKMIADEPGITLKKGFLSDQCSTRRRQDH